jgi:hypothetical protein
MIKRIYILFGEAVLMLFRYARNRIWVQVKSVAFIILYLVFFQILILKVPLSNALSTAGGIVLVVLGLAFFLEGLILGLMPLGERVGVKLPTRTGIVVIAIFGLILGFGATLAEPAISALRTAGSTIPAWDSPLLFMLLQRYTEWLVIAVGTGVGVSVALGMFRFYFRWSIKPLIYIIIPLILVLSVVANYYKNLSKVIGFAWDCGAVNTGAVTVPLILALGIGVSRAYGKGQGSSGGFGVIMLASAFPILAVLTLGVVLRTRAPLPTDEKTFFSPAFRNNALAVFESEEQLQSHAFTHAGEDGRIAFFGDEEKYRSLLLSLNENPELLKSLIGKMSLSEWIIKKASDNERNILSHIDLSPQHVSAFSVGQVLKEESIAGSRAVIPLSLLLLIVLVIILREKIRYKDEVALGIIFSLAGMILLTSGIRLGLASLGGEVGSRLPRAFAKEEKFIDRMVINNFDTTLLFKAITADGQQKVFFEMIEEDKINRIEFVKERYDHDNQQYEYIIMQKPSRITDEVVDKLPEVSTIKNDTIDKIQVLDSPVAYVLSL